MSCAHRTRADLYTGAAFRLAQVLDEHRIRHTADQFADMMDTYWTMLQRGPVALNCAAGVLTFHPEGGEPVFPLEGAQ